jgi:imidazolonepropionase
MSEKLALTLSLACLQSGLTAAEAFYGVTRGAALALRRSELGQLTVGGPADLVVFSCSSYRHLPYHLGMPHAQHVVKGREVVFQGGLAFCAGRAQVG